MAESPEHAQTLTAESLDEKGEKVGVAMVLMRDIAAIETARALKYGSMGHFYQEIGTTVVLKTGTTYRLNSPYDFVESLWLKWLGENA